MDSKLRRAAVCVAAFAAAGPCLVFACLSRVPFLPSSWPCLCHRLLLALIKACLILLASWDSQLEQTQQRFLTVTATKQHSS